MFQNTVKVYRNSKEEAYQMYLSDPDSINAPFDKFCEAMDRAVERQDNEAEHAKNYDIMMAQYG